MNDRFRDAIQNTAGQLREHEQRILSARAEWSGPKAGMVFTAPSCDLPFYWLVLSAHPDDPNLLRVVPVSDFPFAGVCDVDCPDLIHRAHCNLSEWIPATWCSIEWLALVGSDWEITASNCRQILSRMARGWELFVFDSQRITENDPNYIEHIRELTAEIEHLKRG